MTETCTLSYDGGKIATCQTRSHAFQDFGDSGAPAFQRLGGDSVALLGIMHSVNVEGHYSVYSPIDNIRDDHDQKYGAFEVEWRPAFAVIIIGDRTPVKGSNQTYTALVEDSYGSLSYSWKRDGVIVSTASTYQAAIPGSDPTPIILTLAVTDAGNTVETSVTITPSLSVSLLGPTMIKPGATCTWTASANGTAPFGYNWYNDNIAVGYQQAYTGSKDPGNLGDTFTLRVDVQDDAGFNGSAEIEVREDARAMTCFM